MTIIPLPRTRQETEGHTEAPSTLPSCPAPETLLLPDLPLLLTLATGHSGQRQRAGPTWHHLWPWRKWGTCGSRGCLSLCPLPRGSASLSHAATSPSPPCKGPRPCTEASPQAKRTVNLGIVRTAPLTPLAPNGTCQGLDPGPLKEPGRTVVIVQLIVWGIPAGIDPAVRWLVAHVFILRG